MSGQTRSGQSVTTRAFKGTFVLGFRQISVQLLGAVGGIILARLLSPAEFGAYAINTFFFTLLLAVGDLGLGASLIRQVDEPGKEDLHRVFAARQSMDLISLSVFWCLAPWLALAYGLAADGIWSFRLLGVALLVTSFQVVPVVKLERQLAFGRLAFVEITQVLVYTSAVIIMVWRGTGVLSFGLAWLAYSCVGAGLSTLVCSWPMGWKLDLHWASKRLGFSLPFQGISLANLARDSINPILVGLVLGTAQVGYINWAQMVALFVVLGLGVLQRVYMPSFARLQNSANELAVLVEHAIRMTNVLVAPVAVLSLVLIDPITRIVFGEKWLTALPLFYVLWLVNLFAPTTVVLISLLNALGRSRRAFAFTLLMVLGTWLLGAPLILSIGALGYAVATVSVQLATWWLVKSARECVPFRIVPLAAPVWLWAGIVGSAVFLLHWLMPINSLIQLLVYAGLGVFVYFAGLYKCYAAQISVLWRQLVGDGVS
jgi:O-antigen/teichoic acid export membrane protein